VFRSTLGGATTAAPERNGGAVFHAHEDNSERLRRQRNYFAGNEGVASVTNFISGIS
jgi:hypothetical protein